ncbi:hypothetical protein ANME2D_02525 [Candidatus Methanoperedens nitroreducens]|uniref:Uncharacterized protein n=1 Tax=Candidatus Methanoperedens nitratireducens TaxID=1392998 RepID=A0A062V542_9EURY|nr:hypothetical protein [Candidatus Methanoperedens nitroreducens]KCZ70505.1 hypothetical protein ANME2D_02525 [Candidatus Methanoperedens nitroreducens]MDJ1420356.1 hypothetical protein [Candidatus Methanoperedens sp.]
MTALGRSIFGGIAGGVVGATVMTIILIGSKAMIGMPMLTDFVVMGTFVGGTESTVVGAGFIAHYLLGIILGAALGAIVASSEKLQLTSWGKAAGVGLLYGVIVWLVVFIPTLMYGFAPIMMNMMGPAAADMFPMVLGIAFIEHLLYGMSAGALIFVATRTEHY